MPLQHAVLALLAVRPSYGYDLKDQFEQAVGPQWGLNLGHLYQVLDRLRRDQLVTAQVVPQSQRPDRTMYSITEAGREELDAWLNEPAVRTRGYRNDFFLKLMAAARRSDTTLAELIRIQRQAHLQELRTLVELRHGSTANVMTKLLLDAAVLHTQADLQLTELAEEHLARLDAAGHAEPENQETMPASPTPLPPVARTASA